MNPKNAEIARRLREFGEKKYPSMAAFARALGIRPQALSSYLKARSRPGYDLLMKLKELGCDIDWLMTGKGENPIFFIGKDEKEVLSYLKSLGINSVEEAQAFFAPENIAQDIALLLRERAVKYQIKRKGKSS